MPTRKRVGAVQRVRDESGREIMRVSVWDDGSLLVTVPHPGPMAISQFFSGRGNLWTNIRVVPIEPNAL